LHTEIHPDIEKILVSSEDIKAKARVLGKAISKDFKGRRPVLVGVLRGCVLFMSDLAQNITIDCSMDFICPSSYNGGVKSTGVVQLLLDLRESIEGRDVILVEDVVDTGLTMRYLLDNLNTRKPKSITVCTLLDKRCARRVDVPVHYSGFEIGNEFVVGYGLDYKEIYRNLPYIGTLRKSKI